MGKILEDIGLLLPMAHAVIATTLVLIDLQIADLIVAIPLNDGTKILKQNFQISIEHLIVSLPTASLMLYSQVPCSQILVEAKTESIDSL